MLRKYSGLFLGAFVLISHSSGAWATGPFFRPASRETPGHEVLDQSLMDAARDGRVEDARKLIEQGAKPGFANHHGKTPLMLAAIFGHYKIAQLLLDSGADPDQADDQDNSPVLVAGQSCSNRVLEVLVKRGVNVNQRNHNNRTALIAASEQGCARSVEILLKSPGVDVNARDDWYKSAYDYASESWTTGVDMRSAQMLRAAGARTGEIKVPQPPSRSPILR